MRKDKKEEKANVWLDILLILIMTKFVMERFTYPSLFGALAVLILIAFLGLRSHFIQNKLRTALSIAAVAAYMIDVFILKGPTVFTIFLIIIAFLLGFYYFMRRLFGHFGFK